MSDTPRTDALVDGPFGDSSYKALAEHARTLERELAQAYERAAEVCRTAPDLLQDSTFDGAARAILALKNHKT